MSVNVKSLRVRQLIEEYHLARLARTVPCESREIDTARNKCAVVICAPPGHMVDAGTLQLFHNHPHTVTGTVRRVRRQATVDPTPTVGLIPVRDCEAT